MAQAKFYRCKSTGEVVVVLKGSDNAPSCCGEEMELLDPMTSDGAREKHVPVVTMEENHLVVNVGEVDHPMTEEHSIEWIALVTPSSVQVKYLQPGEAPHTKFGICPKCTCTDRTVYAYCNIHGLFAADVK